MKKRVFSWLFVIFIIQLCCYVYLKKTEDEYSNRIEQRIRFLDNLSNLYR